MGNIPTIENVQNVPSSQSKVVSFFQSLVSHVPRTNFRAKEVKETFLDIDQYCTEKFKAEEILSVIFKHRSIALSSDMGTGKSSLAYFLADAIRNQERRIFIVYPRVMHLQQKAEIYGDADKNPLDIGLPVATFYNETCEDEKQFALTSAKVVNTTYHSLHHFKEVIGENDIVFFDEIHRACLDPSMIRDASIFGIDCYKVFMSGTHIDEFTRELGLHKLNIRLSEGGKTKTKLKLIEVDRDKDLHRSDFDTLEEALINEVRKVPPMQPTIHGFFFGAKKRIKGIAKTIDRDLYDVIILDADHKHTEAYKQVIETGMIPSDGKKPVILLMTSLMYESIDLHNLNFDTFKIFGERSPHMIRQAARRARKMKTVNVELYQVKRESNGVKLSYDDHRKETFAIYEAALTLMMSEVSRELGASKVKLPYDFAKFVNEDFTFNTLECVSTYLHRCDKYRSNAQLLIELAKHLDCDNRLFAYKVDQEAKQESLKIADAQKLEKLEKAENMQEITSKDSELNIFKHWGLILQYLLTLNLDHELKKAVKNHLGLIPVASGELEKFMAQFAEQLDKGNLLTIAYRFFELGKFIDLRTADDTAVLQLIVDHIGNRKWGALLSRLNMFHLFHSNGQTKTDIINLKSYQRIRQRLYVGGRFSRDELTEIVSSSLPENMQFTKTKCRQIVNSLFRTKRGNNNTVIIAEMWDFDSLSKDLKHVTLSPIYNKEYKGAKVA